MNMRKLLFLLAATILLVCTACNGSFTDPGMADQPGGGISGSGSGSGSGGGGGGGSGGGGSGGGGGNNNGNGTSENPFQLTENNWTNGEIKSDTPKKELWYSFNVTKDTTYYVWWNDRGNGAGDGTKNLNVRVSASYSNDTSIFTNEDAAWSAPKQFKATSNGTVKLKVYPNTSTNNGTFAIVYSTTNKRPR